MNNTGNSTAMRVAICRGIYQQAKREKEQENLAMLTSSIRATQLDTLLREAANVVGGKLRNILQPGVSNESVGVSFHIQAGVVNHFRELDDFSLRPNAPEPQGDLVERATMDAMRALKLRLEMSLVESFHGIVLLRVEVNDGQPITKCGGEKVRKVASPRVPV